MQLINIVYPRIISIKKHWKERFTMATQSIMRNIVIDEHAAAEKFVAALEKASEIPTNLRTPLIEAEDIKGDDIKKLLGAVIK